MNVQMRAQLVKAIGISMIVLALTTDQILFIKLFSIISGALFITMDLKYIRLIFGLESKKEDNSSPPPS